MSLLPREYEPWCDPSVVLSAGPARVVTDDPPEDFVPLPFLGFGTRLGTDPLDDTEETP